MMKSVFVQTICAGVVLMGCVASQAGVIEITSANPTYSQNFNGIRNDTTGDWGVGGVSGWSIFARDRTAIAGYRTSDGELDYAGVYNFGSWGSSDRALGAIGSGGTIWKSPPDGTTAGWIAVELRNTGSTAFTGFTLSYVGEQWRNSGNSEQKLVLEYALNSAEDSFFSTTGWKPLGASFDFNSPVTGGTAGALDGNLPANRITGIGGTFSGINWAPNTSLWLRWTEINDPGNDHGLAIDDFTLTAVPEPTNVALAIFAGVGVIGAVVRRKLAKKC